MRIIEGNPAGHHLARDNPVLITVILVKSQRLRAGRFPDHVVLIDARPRPAAKLGYGFADMLMKYNGGNGTVRFPGIANLPGGIIRAYACLPVPLVGLQSRFKSAGKKRLKTGADSINFCPIKDILDDDKAIAMEGFYVMLGEIYIHD